MRINLLPYRKSDFQKPNGVNHVLDCGDADREGMTDYDSSDEIFD